jgi:trans-aconitate methyltransferase
MSQFHLNVHGDRLVPTTGAHGADIASQRVDALDKRALKDFLDLDVEHPVCLDLGCGFGMQGSRFALLGGRSYFYDLIPPSGIVSALQEQGLHIKYVRGDLRIAGQRFPSNVSIVFSQRFVHYLKFTEANTLFTAVASHMRSQALVYVSASGINSELGNHYSARDMNVEDRFGPLAKDMQEKHQIFEEVCLYDEEALKHLMKSCGFDVEVVWQSTFGNIKGVFTRRN